MSIAKIVDRDGNIIRTKTNKSGMYDTVKSAKQAAKLYIHQNNKRRNCQPIFSENLQVIEYDLREIERHPIN